MISLTAGATAGYAVRVSFVRTLLLFAFVGVVACAVDVSGLPDDGAVATECMEDEECSDSVDCTDDTCGADGVCVYTEVDSRCAEGEVCIAATGCQPESACNAEDCADALRVALTCQVGACQDDGTCLGETTCAAGESCCGDGTCMDCDDGNPCTEDSCDPSGCVHMPLDGTPCDDGDFCTGTEVCSAGTCRSSGDPCESPTFCNVDRCVGCRNAGDCPDDIVPPFGSCDYSDVCDTNAIRRRTVTSFSCVAEECVGSDSEETDNCMRSTTNDVCGSDSVGPWTSCGGFSNTCDETGTRTRDRTIFRCGGGTCGSSTSPDPPSACNRDTDGTMCMPTNTPSWGACGEFSDMCDETGVQRRTITTYDCAGGSCNGTDEDRMRDCTRDTDDRSGCATPDPDVVGPCEQTNPGTCDKTGSRTITSYGTICMDGSCVQVPAMRTESCTFETDGDSCGAAGPCAGQCSDGGCNMNANDGVVCAGSGTCASECNGGSCDASANDGASCDDGIGCTGDGSCSGGSCTMGGDTCGGGDCSGCGGVDCDCRDVGGGTYECACP